MFKLFLWDVTYILTNEIPLQENSTKTLETQTNRGQRRLVQLPNMDNSVAFSPCPMVDWYTFEDILPNQTMSLLRVGFLIPKEGVVVKPISYKLVVDLSQFKLLSF